MEQVHLHFHIRRAHGLHDAVRVVLPVEVKARHAARVDGLDQYIAPDLGGFGCGPFQVGHQRCVCGFGICTFGPQAHHGMDARAVQRLGINQGLRETGAKFAFATGHAGRAPAACFPGLGETGAVGAAGRGVEQHLLQAVALQTGGQLLRRIGIGKQIFHRLKAVFGRSLKAVQKRQIGVHH